MQAQGTVEVLKVETTTTTGKALRSPLYTVKLSDGGWYKFGFDNPNVQQGDSISFSYKEGQWGKEGNAETVVKQEAAPAQAAKPAAGGFVDRQASIVYQSQHRDAISAINFAIENELIKLPTKQADKFDVYMELIHDTTVQWCKEAMEPDLTEELPDVPEMDDE